MVEVPEVLYMISPFFQHKNYNLPIRDKPKQSQSFKSKKPSKQFNPEVDGFESDERQFETVKRDHAHSVHTPGIVVTVSTVYLVSTPVLIQSKYKCIAYKLQ